MTSIIIAALGVAVVGLAALRAWLVVSNLRSVRTSCGGLAADRDRLLKITREHEAKIARLTPLAEIGLRRVKAVEKYEAKHRKGNGDA